MSGLVKTNAISYSQTIDANTGVQNTTPININGYYSLAAGGNFNKQFKFKEKWTMTSNSEIFSYYNENSFLINQFNTVRKTKGISFNQDLSINWNNLFDFNPSYKLTVSKSSLSEFNTGNFLSYRHQFSSQFNLYWPKRWILETNYNYIYNSQISSNYSPTINLLNASISFEMLKENRGLLKISAFDILNQNSGITSYASNNLISDQVNNVLKRYFMLSYVYIFNSTKLRNKL